MKKYNSRKKSFASTNGFKKKKKHIEFFFLISKIIAY